MIVKMKLRQAKKTFIELHSYQCWLEAMISRYPESMHCLFRMPSIDRDRFRDARSRVLRMRDRRENQKKFDRFMVKCAQYAERQLMWAMSNHPDDDVAVYVGGDLLGVAHSIVEST